MDVSFQKLVDIKALKKMVLANYAASGIPIGVVDAVSGEIYAGVGWQRICTHFHRKHPETLARCVESDTAIAGKITKGETLAYKCKNGLWDIGIPIMCDNRHIATIFLGQFIYEDEKIDKVFFKNQAAEYGFNVDDYLGALEAVPVFTKEKVGSILEYNKALAEFLSDQATTNWRLRQEFAQRKQAESLHTELESLFDHAQVGLMVLRGERHLVKGNQRLADILGYGSPVDMQGLSKKALHLTEERYVEFGEEHHNALTRGEKLQIEYELRRKDGTPVWCSLSGKALDTENPSDLDKGVLWVVDDITEKKKAEQTLKESELLMKNIFNALKEAVLVLDPQRELINVNHATQDIFGYSAKELYEQSTAVLHVDHEHYLEFGNRLRETFSEAAPTEFEFEARRKNGEIFPTEHTVSMMKDDTGKALGIVSVVRDITERKNAENELRKLLSELERSNNELKQFAYVASHDLQEPLRAVAGFLQLLQSRYQSHLDAKGRHYIERSVKAAQRMQTLITDLLSLSRVNTTPLSIETHDIGHITEQVVESLQMLIQEKNADITFGNMPCLPVDVGQIQSLFQNLLLNSLKYNENKNAYVVIECQDQDNEYCFSIKDNGIGISDKFHERIFLVFQRLHTEQEYTGTGIGLALCRRIVERHGGKIWVESQPGQGATFYFTLPKKR